MTRLFTTFEEIKQFIGADANNELHTLEPYIDDAARDFIIPILGQQEYDLLCTNYDAETLTPAQTAILPSVQNALANFAYYYFADDGTMNISDSGFIRQEHSEGKSAYQWQVRKFKERRHVQGWSTIQSLILFLYNNKADYALWAASPERTVWNNFFVWNTAIFKKFHRIGSLDTLFTLHPTMSEVQEITLKGLLTQTLYDEILGQIMSNTLSAANILLIQYIQRCVVFATLAQVVDNFGYEFGLYGLQVVSLESTTQNSDKISNASTSARAILKNQFERKYLEAYNLLVNFLNSNSTSLVYPSYYTEYINITSPEVTDHNEDKGVVFFG